MEVNWLQMSGGFFLAVVGLLTAGLSVREVPPAGKSAANPTMAAAHAQKFSLRYSDLFEGDEPDYQGTVGRAELLENHEIIATSEFVREGRDLVAVSTDPSFQKTMGERWKKDDLTLRLMWTKPKAGWEGTSPQTIIFSGAATERMNAKASQ